MSATDNAKEVQAVANGHATSPQRESSGVGALVLDVTKLHSLPSEQQEIFLLTFVSNLLQYVEAAPSEILISEQREIKKELIKILGLSSPVPNRVIRNVLGCTFAAIFKRGNRSLLYESINEFLGVVNAGKNEQDLKTKYAAVVCLGHTFRAAGDSAISLSSLTLSSLLKLFKSAQNHAGLRGVLYWALAGVVQGVSSSLDEQGARDIWKHARNSISNEKAILAQKNALSCVEQLIISTEYFTNSNDFDSLKTTLFKAIEHSSAAIRHAAASCLATILVKAYSEDASKEMPTRVKKTKKSSKKTTPQDEDEAIERPESPMSKKSATALDLSFQEILRTLGAQYQKTSSMKAKATIAVTYKLLMTRLPERVIEEEYGVIADHLFNEVLGIPSVIYNRHRLLMTRKFVKVILQDTIGSKVLGESAKINAARWLINDVVKNYPKVVQERREPSKHALTAALDALSTLVSELGSAANILADICREGLFQVIQHPSYTVQVHTAYCFRSFVLACPQQLLPCAEMCLKDLKRELENLQSPRRCVGFANGLAAMLGTSREQALYGSLDLYSRTLNLAIELFKASSDSELRVSAAQIQVAWILIGGLMPLGPNFVKIHLSQLLLLWKNALPMPLARENIAQRRPLELSFLAHVRECALGSLLVFIEYNSSLITTDGARRIAGMLENTMSFLETLPAHKTAEEIANRLTPSLQLRDLAIMVRRRVLQCYCKLAMTNHGAHAAAVSHSSVLGLAVSSFMEPEVDVAKSLENSMASSANNFEGLWEMGDNSGSGVTSLVEGYDFRPLLQQGGAPVSISNVSHAISVEFERALSTPICDSKEHDSVLLYAPSSSNATSAGASPPATEVVNAAIRLFAIALPHQSSRIQESSLEQLTTLLQASSRQREPARRAAIAINTAAALLYTTMVVLRDTPAAPGNLASPTVQKLIQEVLRPLLTEADPYLRNLAAQSLGRLASSSGSQFTNTEVNYLIDAIVGNRSPEVRAGCALALGSIHTHIGGMAAGLHLKSIVGILLSLCADPHPIVHFWAIEALRQVTDTAGLTFSGYVTNTLGMVAQLYASDTHSEESESLTASNMEVEYSSTATLARVVDSLINVLGPDMADMSKLRKLILTMLNFITHEDDMFFHVQGMLCLRHLVLYSPTHVDLTKYIKGLRGGLQSDDVALRHTAIEGLSDMIKRNARNVVDVGGEGFADDIWIALDSTPHDENLRQIISNWLQQTALSDTPFWVQRCQEVLSKTKIKAVSQAPPPQPAENPMDHLDEEVAGFAAAAAAAQGEPQSKTEGQEFLKWQTRTFAMTCLSELLSIVSREILPDQHIPAELALQNRIADVVRMAFSASTASVVELRVLGLRIINQVLQLFGKTPDPDFLEASLLEQYQAQIGSALTPAFAADSSPELASEAIKVCATFVATGIVTHVERMGRIFKLLVTGLENISDPAQSGTVGDLIGLTSNARVMLRMALLSAWAELLISSSEQQYLESIVQPYAARLTPLWLSSLQEYARLRFEPEISSTLGTDLAGGNLDDLYAALNRQTLLGYYEDVWLHLINAISSLVDKDSEFVFDALDGKTDGLDGDAAVQLSGKEMRYRDEPVAFFFILYGLAFEALVREARVISSQRLDILIVLKKLLRPAVTGAAIYQDTVFNESMDTLDRLALTGTSATQTVIVDIVRNLSLDHISAKPGEDRDDKLSDDIDQLFELTRIMLLILSGLVPTLEDPPSSHSRSLTDDMVTLVKLTLGSLVDVADIFPSIIRADLYACIVHTFCTILSTGPCQAQVVPESLPLLKRFFETIIRSAKHRSDSETVSRLIGGCLHQFLTILTRAQRRDSEYSLACAKNTLLSITILLTSAGKSLSPKDPLISRALSEIRDCLQDLGLAKVAANCLRSLLMVRPKSPTDESISRQLLPHLLRFVTDYDDEDPENARSLVAQALTTSVSTLSTAGKSAAVAVTMPVLLHRVKIEGESLYAETARRLLELAAADQMIFRSYVANLTEEERSLIQTILQAGRGFRPQSGGEETDEDAKPSIALRMDF